jgi:hypothetical protein
MHLLIPSNPTATGFCDIECGGSSHSSISYESKHIRHVMVGIIGAVPAFPPFRRISKPASVARGCEDATIPFVPYTTDRRLGKGWKTRGGLSILYQSIATEDIMRHKELKFPPERRHVKNL